MLITTTRDMTNKTILITGGTSGIGKETARTLAEMGARVVIVGRSAGKAEQAIRTLRQQTGNQQIEYLLADFTRMRDVHKLADDIRQRYDRLDVLINNAGAMYGDHQLTEDNFEASFAVNYLSHFLLTNQLLGLLSQSAPARIINVAAAAHKTKRLIGDALDLSVLTENRGCGPDDYSGSRAYAWAKYAVVMFTFALARRLVGTRVTANVLTPGFTTTSLGDDLRGRERFTASMTNRLFGVSLEESAATSVFLASSPEVQSISGMYFMNGKPALPAEGTRDAVAQEALWTMSENWVFVPESMFASA